MKKFDDLPAADEDLASDKGKQGLNRRDILTGTAGAVAAAGLGATSAYAKGRKHPLHHPAKPQGAMAGMDMGDKAQEFHAANPKKWFQPFLEPKVVTSERNGTLAQQLNVGFNDVTITTFDDSGNPVSRTQCVRCYNGTVPGTTFRVAPGDKLEFTLNNQLPPNQPAPPPGNADNCEQLMDANFPGCFNTTNLHTHGLHVSPKSDAQVSSDDVSVKIVPNNDTMSPCSTADNCYIGTRNYCVQLPTFHAPGTHWYHAHVHGATGIQVSNGLAGAIIVEETYDDKIPSDSEYIWMIQEVFGGANAPGACTTNPNDPNVYLSGSSVYSNMKASSSSSVKPYGSAPPTGIGFTVNSLSSPTLKIQPNEIQRWRIIDGTATPRGIFNFVLLQPILDSNGNVTGYNDFSNCMYLVAVDGITFYGHSPQQLPVSSATYPVNPNTNPNGPNKTPGGWALAPGNRADVLVSISQPGNYQVWRYDNSNTGGGPICQILANVEVAGPSMPQRNVAQIPLPGWDKAPCYIQPIQDSEINAADLAYNFQVNGGYFGGFTINNQVYGNPDGTHPNTTVKLGDVRRTKLSTTAGSANHPYHIHVNPFQVEHDKIDPNGPDDPSNWRWWDTILVPQASEFYIRSRYVNYDGGFVLHCHILIHEDAGMMQDFTVEADPANGYPAVAPCTPLSTCQKGRPPST